LPDRRREGGIVLNRFSHVMLYVQDLERAMKWYASVFGFTTLYAHPPHYAALRHPGLNFRLDLHPAKPGSPDIGHGAVPYFATADLDAAVARLRQAGVEVTDPRREGDSLRFCSFTDCEGNLLGLTESNVGG
jgi:predicted enzyme related to lactoylglutathione lyase